MKDISIIIAHRGNPMGLWATIHSCEIELANSEIDYEYVIVVNGEYEVKKTGAHRCPVASIDLSRILEFVGKSGRLGHVTLRRGNLAPPTARQIGSEHAVGKYLFFLDNHCLVGKDYFRRAIADFEHYGMHMLHSTTKFFSGDNNCYEYRLQLEKNFWADAQLTPGDNVRPYRIAAGGHGGFAVRADVWHEVGGYWTGFKGYGGEEMYFDLKMAMLDKTNWIDPLVVHYHYAGQRPYERHYSADYYKNMMMCANIIGGEHWLYKIYESFRYKFPQPRNTKMYDLLLQASDESREHKEWLDSRRLRTLDEQLVLFKEQGIAH